MKGKIYLLPVTLGGFDYRWVIPENVIATTKMLRFFVVENLRTARRYLRFLDREFPLEDSVFFELNEHTAERDLSGLLEPLLKGNDVGLMSEAGLPGIADPGSLLISLAHRKGIRVIPLSGPSSVFLALAASGMNGQNFTFNGYLPVKPAERSFRLREIEKQSVSGCAQIFMETPYRNQKMMDAILQVCQKDTVLCVAADITLPSESIMTMTVSEWKRNTPDLKNRLVIFVLQQNQKGPFLT